MFIKYFQQKIDNYIFSRTMEKSVVLSKDDLEYLKNHNTRICRIADKIRHHISDTALLAHTEEALKRRRYWIECLDYIKTLSNNEAAVKVMKDYRTLKPMATKQTKK